MYEYDIKTRMEIKGKKRYAVESIYSARRVRVLQALMEKRENTKTAISAKK